MTKNFLIERGDFDEKMDDMTEDDIAEVRMQMEHKRQKEEGFRVGYDGVLGDEIKGIEERITSNEDIPF